MSNPTETGIPVCYRHPGRETYVRCTRCNRPICPDCMHEAAVGHQCPECVREGNRDVRQARSVFGGRTASGSPVVTITILALNVVLYLAELATPDVVNRFAMLGEARTPLGEVVPGIGVAGGEWYRLVTSAFLHSPPPSIFHILFNMWALWVLGPQLEQLLGRLRFTVLYLLSAVGGSVLLYLISPDKVAVGASGAIFGLFAATFVIGRRLGAETGWIVGLLAINLVITFLVPQIAWEGHIGGLVTGGLLAAAYAYAPARQRTAIHVTASVGLAALLAVLVAVQTVSLTG